MPYWQYLGLSCRGAQAAEEQCGSAAAVRRGGVRRLSAVCQPTCKGNMLEHIYFVIAFRVCDMHCIARMR